MRALWLADVLRAAGLTVVETAGWQTRGYELTAIEGVTCHHTASPPTSTLGTNLNVVTNGNSIAPGPIAQILLWRDGTCYIITSGKANHAGAGGPWGWLPISPPGQLSVANARCLSIEAVNNGVGELWADRMLDAYEIAVAAILEHIGQNQSRVFTHHEWAPTRKIDPAGPTGGRIPTINRSQTWSGDAWRARIASRLTHRPDPPPRPPDKPTTPPQPILEDDAMLKYRDKRFGNVFLINGGVTTTGGNLAAAVPGAIVTDVHDQSLISYMRASHLTMAEMVPAGPLPGDDPYPPFNPPADLR